MQDNRISVLLQDRQPLEPQAVLQLYNDRGEAESFRIDSLLGAGGTSLVYHVTRLSETEGNVKGSLKEFYPRSAGSDSFDLATLIRSMEVTRREDGALELAPDLCEARVSRLRRVIHLLHDLKMSGDLNYFIPYVQLYRGACGVPYVFTPENLSGITLEEYRQEAFRTPDQEHLMQILNTMYAIACADELLCSRDAFLLDIKPANVLLVRRSGGAPDETTYLADAVSLFDVESILLRQELDSRPELPVSPGFTAPELGGYVTLPRYFRIGPASDVYALTATLLYCLTGCLPGETDNYARTLEEGPFGAEIRQSGLCGILSHLLKEGLAYQTVERISTPGEFSRRIMEAVNRLELYRIAETARSEREQAEKMPDMLTHLLFRWPLHEYAADQDMRVLIAGTEQTAIWQALDAVFSACHVLGHQLHIVVAAPDGEAITWKWCSRIHRAASWLEYKGCEPFTPYPWEQKMAQICCEPVEATRHNINELVERRRANAVLLLTENRGAGSAMAVAIRPPQQGTRLVAYCGGAGKTLYPERQQDGQTVVCMTPADCDDSFRDVADRIGFNAHFLYEREKNRRSTLQNIRHTYWQNAYNHAASQDTALAVKCKLWSAGVPWTNEPARDAACFAQKLEQDPSLVAAIAWLEHRRWIASKLIRGTRTLPESEYELLFAGNNNESGTNIRMPGEDGREHLYHAYLVPSRMDGARPEGWQTPAQWASQPLDRPVPAELDPLDRACVGLTRLYIQEAAHTDLKASKQALSDKLHRHLLWLRTHASDQAGEFALLTQTLERAVNKLENQAQARPEDVMPYTNSCLRLEELLKNQQGPWVPSIRGALENLDREVRVIIQALCGVDAKRYDTTLVENMGFLLCGGRLTMGKLLSDGCLTDNLRPADFFLLDRLVCAAWAADTAQARQYGELYRNLCRSLALLGMDIPTELRLFLAPGARAPEEIPNLVPVPAQAGLESAFAAAMEDCNALDMTGGQPELAACSGLLDSGRVSLLRFEDGVPLALRGVLPPMVPVRQPLTLDCALALSGAEPVQDGAEACAPFPGSPELYGQLVESGLFDECRGGYACRLCGGQTPVRADVAAICGGRPVLIFCRECPDPAEAEAIRRAADSLKAAALPVLVAPPRPPEEQAALEERCRTLGVLLLLAGEPERAAARIAEELHR